MARSRGILERFRPAGTPGAAAKSGVPADHVAEAAAELAPVLELLSGTLDEAQKLRADAKAEAERVRREGRDKALAVVSEARRDAESERAEAAARVTAQADRESADTLAAAEQQAAEVRRRGSELVPARVEQVLATVRASFQEPGP